MEEIEVETFYDNGVVMVRYPDGTTARLADVYRQAFPGRDFDDMTGLEMAMPPPPADAPAAPPRREYQFGDVGSRMGNETLAAAGDTFANAGNVTRSMLPESVQAYVPPSVSYLPDMALGGLLGVVGAGEKAIGYGAELGDMAARNVVKGLGFDWPYAPGTSARKLAGDIIGGLDAAGAAPEGRMLGAIVDVAGPAMRRGVMDAATEYLVDDFGGVNLNAFPFYHGTPDGRDVRAAGGFNDGKPVFLSDNRSVARTYADPRRAWDYQGAEPEVFTAMTSPQRVLDIDARGSDFRGISADAVTRGLLDAGIPEVDVAARVSAAAARRSDGRISTNDLANIVRGLGFDAADIANVRDTYNATAKAPKSTVRMMFNPSQISIDGVTRSAPTDPAIQRAEEVLSLIKSGRADEVTREMLDMGDDVLNARLNEHLWNNYDLPMDEASRMERARGFQGGLYSGTGDNFTAFSGQSWATDNPDLAYTYAPSAGGSIMPLMMRAKHGAPVINAGGANWNALTPSMREGGPQAPYLRGILTDPEDLAKYGEDLLTTQNFADAAKEQGFSGVTFNDVVDVGGYMSKYFPEGPQRDAQRASIARAGQPSKVEMRLYPNQVRSRFARFDPRLRHLDNLNASVAGALGFGGLLSLPQEEQY